MTRTYTFTAVEYTALSDVLQSAFGKEGGQVEEALDALFLSSPHDDAPTIELTDEHAEIIGDLLESLGRDAEAAKFFEALDITEDVPNPVVASTPFYAGRWTIREYANGIYDAAEVNGNGLSHGLNSFDAAVEYVTDVEKARESRPTLVTKRTSELCEGDVVVTHGMRCLIDGHMRVTEYGDRPVHHYQALVLNRDDVPGEVVPFSWTRDWQRNGKPADNGEHRWTIQGNDLAQWSVEAREERTDAELRAAFNELDEADFR